MCVRCVLQAAGDDSTIFERMALMENEQKQADKDRRDGGGGGDKS
jgi:hypothetical protein